MKLPEVMTVKELEQLVADNPDNERYKTILEKKKIHQGLQGWQIRKLYK